MDTYIKKKLAVSVGEKNVKASFLAIHQGFKMHAKLLLKGAIIATNYSHLEL